MAITLPEPVKRILQDPTHGHVITFDSQGTLQVTLVWLDVDGNDVVFNTAEGRVTPRNLRRRASPTAVPHPNTCSKGLN